MRWRRPGRPRSARRAACPDSVGKGAAGATPAAPQQLRYALSVLDSAVGQLILSSPVVHEGGHHGVPVGVGLVGGFCIDGDYRGCGLSAQILGQAISVYRSLGKTWLCAHVAEKNLRAQGFYRKFAFEQRGEHRDANGLHYRMFKRLTAE